MPLFPILPLLLCLLAGGTAAETDLQILLNLKSSLKISTTTPGFESWSSDHSPCNFSGIVCDSTGSVTEINLNDSGVHGTIPFQSVCKLPSLSKLALGSNNLTGDVTADIRNCTKLQHLDLGFNMLTGTVPDLSPLTGLRVLDITMNRFSGQFPWESLGNLTDLVDLRLGDNGGLDPSPFPESVRNLTKLSSLYLSVLNLNGEIPSWIGDLTALVDLEFADNKISGVIPPEISKLRNLNQLEIYDNALTGEIPAGFGNLSNLAFFDASQNQLSGNLSEIRFLTKLVSLQLFMNGFSGEVPQELGEFRELVNLSLYSNQLSGELPEKLGSWAKFNFIDVSTNSFTGKIPPDMCRQGTMLKLLMLENKFSGEIPASYGNCTTLGRFRVSNNSLSGVIPTGIWSLPNVNIIDLTSNNFEGQIDSGIGKAGSLHQLFIANNQFTGKIPPEIAEATSLVSIDVSFNQFSGSIPDGIGELKQLTSIDLEDNSISGPIPDSLGGCTALSSVNLRKNSISGPIPASIGQLPNLNSLDLSDNKLSGQIPASLMSLKLSSLNFSNNQLEGEVPPAISIPVFNESFIGNPGLCGYDIDFLRRCSSEPDSSPARFHTLLVCLLVACAILLVSLTLITISRKRKSDGHDHPKLSWDVKSFRKLTVNENTIIDSIKPENLIGKGGSGNVYRAALGNGIIVAVKHIPLQPDPEERGTTAMLGEKRINGSREFDAEVTTLSAIRHVNVVKLYCSVTCEEASLLVYEYLPNGSLWDRLHTCEGEKLGLDWEARVEIALGAARGLEYLHHGCDRPILHRDVKSSNILLDEQFKPRIADFGLARILRSGGGGRDSFSSHVVAGTYGYIAPEYAYTWKVNEKSDVYSFGVVLMELVTGKRPIEPIYGEGKDIVNWVAEQLASEGSVVKLVDKKIPEWAKDEALKVLRIAVLCTMKLPAMRPSMRTVVHLLEEVAVGRVVIRLDFKNGSDNKAESRFSVEDKGDEFLSSM
ncbi:receptor-like protein kinase 7 [Dioscorea cayenensis subsp. rotundata]|uniref:non-specific serine/threonine protein kinase n=1 Tax=Dioscorea cayennensis subsp. rotundata TaxID=55577 RepID=A0AB40CIP5_DIOCR|nr:receptor-like protein kinase 7 [Dioscorea cayenensis subsp. rotundata]